MSEEIKKFFRTYTDFVTKVTSDPSLNLEALKKALLKLKKSQTLKHLVFSQLLSD